ncbi:hypothetical protein TTHERM_00137890 (macronuclear) [Tetrahymena thermophila SB210]|uniref:Uncharacterized protein n=1 Tax=Tetrahymena thermophila (strain SB210) TaxID=312017 RepID=I7LVQ6_TETTS|nr:hypothetical protein TTHERM_00137890 [Tetrahymena thermophila SB210]EAR99526.1 hypothetical protein TTHERM_00137890 [Tetrahymena thermophila SB210]|eukprot:XP_001019771.1 hypothetical protein TTHERM_00137890 [Tetrahymena thermophila SB210]
MTSLNEKLSLFDENKFNEDNGEFAELMKTQLVSQMTTAIQEGRDLFSKLQTHYKEYYQNGFTMSIPFQKEFKRIAHSCKGQAKLCYVYKMYEILAALQDAIGSSNRNEIDKQMYESFAFKKKYFECLYAVKGENVEEPDFDLRQFDEFTHLNLASNYQSAPINSKSFTFSQIGNQSIAQNMPSQENQRNKVLVSETRNEVVENIKPKKEIQAAAPQQNGDEQPGQLLNVGEIKIIESMDNLYSICKQNREKGDQLFIFRKPQISHEDLPIDSSLMCSIF